jgi:hypothetical protein
MYSGLVCLRAAVSTGRCVAVSSSVAMRQAPTTESSNIAHAQRPDQLIYYFFGGLIMMWAPAVPEYISHGALSLGLVDKPVDSGVAKGT